MIRTLAPGEPVPAGEPRRYKNGAGYVRLRWLVGTGEYVEVYEHRLLAGLPDAEVHHINGRKDENEPENLAVVDKAEHTKLHAEKRRGTYKRETLWHGYRSRAAYEKHLRGEARRAARMAAIREIVELRASGLTTVEIGSRLGIDPSNVTRACQRA